MIEIENSKIENLKREIEKLNYKLEQEQYIFNLWKKSFLPKIK